MNIHFKPLLYQLVKFISLLFKLIPGLLFGLFFAGIGGKILLETAVPSYQSWHAMKSWQSTSAELLSLSSSGNDTKAVYRYTLAGHKYQNNRIYAAELKDNIGNYHDDLYRQLEYLKTNQQMMTIWFNPDNPAESVIDRNMRWEAFVLTSAFCSVFILVGLSVCYASIKSSRKNALDTDMPSKAELRAEWREKQTDPAYSENFFEFARYRRHEIKQEAELKGSGNAVINSLAWKEKKEWKENLIRSDAKAGIVGMWIVAIFWSTLSSVILFILPRELEKGNDYILIGLIFPLIGLILLIAAYRMTRNWKRTGIIELIMDPFPGSIGGHVGGRLILKKRKYDKTDYKVELECLYSYKSGSGDSRSRYEDVKWAESGRADVKMLANGIELHFRFDVPDDLPEADINQSGDYYFWRLRLSSDNPDNELKRDYNIPVFKTKKKSLNIDHDISAQFEQQKRTQSTETKTAFALGNIASTSLGQVLRFKNEGNEYQFYYPMFRNKILTLFALFFAFAFGFAIFSIMNFFSDHSFMSILVIIFSIPFTLVFLASGIAAIYLPLNNLKVTVAQRQIKALRRLFFIPVKHNVITLQDIKEMEIKSTGSSRQGSQQIKHFKIIVHSHNGERKFTIAEGIDGKDLAYQFKEFIFNRLKMT